MRLHSFTQARVDKVVSFKPERPILTVVVDTEEEFDWDAPFSRDSRATKSISGQLLAHEIFDPLGVKPTYVMDQAVVDCNDSYKMFSELLKDNRCEIGAHLHAWLTPPFEEEVSEWNSFQCNLPYDLEYQKILNLRDSLSDRYGFQPITFKAGRYGIGPNSYKILKDLGFKVDTSVLPYTSYRPDGGSHFYGLPSDPFWVDEACTLLSMPLTRGFTGVMAKAGPMMKHTFDSKLCKAVRIPGIFSRTNMIQRITLTPEGVLAKDQIELIKRLYLSGQRFFSLAYHSSSLGVGHTSYVQTQHDLKALLDNLKDVLTFFKNEIDGQFLPMADVYKMVSSTRG